MDALLLAAWAASSSRYVYDYVVVGGGVAGLYAAYSLEARGERVLLLEASDRWGGRAYQVHWHGSDIKYGAGVIRRQDKHLRSLCSRLGLGIAEFPVDFDLETGRRSLNREQMNALITKITKHWREHQDKVSSLRWDDYMRRYWPEYRETVYDHMGYRDFQDASIADTIEHYPLTDMYCDPSDDVKGTIKDGGWNALIDTLLKGITRKWLGVRVKRISRAGDLYSVDGVLTRRVVFAVTKSALESIELPPDWRRHADEATSAIGAVPFTRLYTYHEKALPKIAGFNVYNSPLQRVVPFSDHVWLSLYADSQTAERWRPMLLRGSKREVIREMTNALKPLGATPIDDVTYHYWEEGIHYYRPSPVLDREAWLRSMVRYGDMFFVGEMVCLSQGWVEGAVESVDRIIDLLESTPRS